MSPAHADMRRAERALSRPLSPQWTEAGAYNGKYAAQLKTIDKINSRANRMNLHDCDVYVWQKIGMLNDIGVRAEYMVVRTETGGYHAIAVVDKRLALDSRYPIVMTLDELRAEGYSIGAVE